MAGAVSIGIEQMVKLAVCGIMLYLIVGKRGMTAGTPVNNIVTLVNQTFVKQPNKHLAHCRG